jgi:hypothetical protein
MKPEEHINPEDIIQGIKDDHEKEKQLSRDKAVKQVLGEDLESRLEKELEIKDIPDD